MQGLQGNYCQDGLEAIERVKENSFDIIFTEVKPPTLNGLETYLAIKKINPEAVVIMITAYR
jgi:YesN/AraC family two-component response regulator